MHPYRENRGVVNRRAVLVGAFAALGASASDQAEAKAQQAGGSAALVAARDRISITKLETSLVKPRWRMPALQSRFDAAAIADSQRSRPTRPSVGRRDTSRPPPRCILPPSDSPSSGRLAATKWTSPLIFPTIGRLSIGEF